MSMCRFVVHAVVLAVLLAAADGVVARDLYTGESVIEEAASGSNDSLARALDEVLTRLTGVIEPSLVERLELGPSELQLLVLSQQRVRRERLAPDGVSVEQELRLQVEFDPAGVDALLAEAGLSRLGRARPSILLWVALEDGEG